MLKSDQRLLHSVSHFVCRQRSIDLPTDEIPGDCSICGIYTENGHRIKLPKTFTAWEHFQEGANICPPCWHMLKTANYRRKSWLVTEKDFTFLSRAEVRPYLTQVPDPPWALYISLSYRKHGWIQTHVNTSRNRFVLTVDDEEYPVTKELIDETIELTRDAAVFIGGSKEKMWKGRWLWLKDEAVLKQEGQMALERPRLYEWFKTHRFDGLTKAVVSVMIPTKTEMKKK